MPPIETIRLPGLTPYAPMLETQHARRGAVARGIAPDTLYLLEHEPVLTCGRDYHKEHLLLPPAQLAALGVTVEPTDRGGDITYHGPGQVVAYPILNLTHRRCSVGWYMRNLEQVIIDLLLDYGLEGERIEGLTGVWVNEAKVAAVGVGMRDWVTFHGMALNVDPDLSHFALIIPCGISDKAVTSLARLLPKPPSMDEAMEGMERHFRRVFEATR